QQVSDRLKAAFQGHNKPLTPQARVEVNQLQTNWTIIDSNTRYAIRKENPALSVYRSDDRGAIYMPASSSVFLDTVTLPDTWLFVSGAHDIKVESEDEARDRKSVV